MDNGLIFPYLFYGGKGGTRSGTLSMPNGHGVSPSKGKAGAGKSTLDIIAEAGGSGGETRSDLANPILPRKASLPAK